MSNIKELTEETIQEFLQRESLLLKNDAGEQALSHRLAVVLEPKFKEWNIDCEYNRDVEAVKRLRYALSPNGDIEDRDVIPDIIIHRRKTSDNLLVIEIKKSTNRESDDKDIAKLRAFREQLGYQNGLFVRFLTGASEVGIQTKNWV